MWYKVLKVFDVEVILILYLEIRERFIRWVWGLIGGRFRLKNLFRIMWKFEL